MFHRNSDSTVDSLSKDQKKFSKTARDNEHQKSQNPNYQPQEYNKTYNPNEVKERTSTRMITIKTYGTEMQHTMTLQKIKAELDLAGFDVTFV